MKLLVSSCARLFKTPDGLVYTPVAYGYDFYKRYLQVFDEVCVAGFCDYVSEDYVKDMLLVSGEDLSVFEVPYPHGEWDYILKRRTIVKSVKNIIEGCDAALLRVPETLCFLIMENLIRGNKPWAIEVTSNPLNLYTKKGGCPSKYRDVYRIWYTHQLRRACKYANGTSYVTEFGLQADFPPNLKVDDHFTTFYTDTDIKVADSIQIRELPVDRPFRLVHIAVSISGFPKGHKEAIMALKEMIDSGMQVELTLVGGGDLAAENQEYMKENGLNKYIRFTGKLKADQVIEELDRADVFFFPSYNEGLPRVVIEAMSRGLPVIATDIPAHHELIESEYLAPVRDSHTLFVIAQNLLKNKEKYKKASRRNLMKAKEYDFTFINQKRIDFFEKLRKLAEVSTNESEIKHNRSDL